MIREIKINRSCELAVRPRAIENHLATRTKDVALTSMVRELKGSKVALFGATLALALPTLFGCANIAKMGAEKEEHVSIVVEKDSGTPDVIEDVVKDAKEEVLPDAPIDVIEDIVKDAKEEVLPDAPIDVIEDIVKDSKDDVIPDVILDVISDVIPDVKPDVAPDVIIDVVTEETGPVGLAPTFVSKTIDSNVDDFTFPISTANPNGWLMLMRHNMECFKAANNLLPDSATPPWTLAQNYVTLPDGSPISGLTTDAVTNEKAYWMNTTIAGTDASYYWKRSGLGLNNSTEWCIQGRTRIESSSPKGEASIFAVLDGTKAVQIGFNPSAMINPDDNSVPQVAVDIKTIARSIEICGQGNNFYVKLEEDIPKALNTIDGTGKLTLPVTENEVYWGDLSSLSNYNAEAYYMHYCVMTSYSGYLQTGSANLTFDIGNGTNNLGSGQVKPIIDGVFPSGSSATITGIRAGNSLPVSGSFVSLNGGFVPTGLSGRYFEVTVQLSNTADHAVTSPLYKGLYLQGLTVN